MGEWPEAETAQSSWCGAGKGGKNEKGGINMGNLVLAACGVTLSVSI